MISNHQSLVNFIFNIANKLRGPYRPPQYRKVMLPMVVLRRLDLVTAEKKNIVLKELKKLKARGLKGNALHSALAKVATKDRNQPLYNISNYTLEKLLEDPEHIAKNLINFINGFSPKAKEIFDYFKFELEVEKLDKNNRLYLIIKEFCKPEIDLHPRRLNNLQMGYIFEELIRKFNEQANEEAGDHFTPREVIKLMAHILYTEEDVIYKEGIIRTIYDPACGTGGMLSESEKYIHEQNKSASLILFGQEYNDESYAICTSDLLIKDDEVDNIIFGDTLGDGKTSDGLPDKRFHYMLANPPFGVEWRPEEEEVKKEHNKFGFDGRFGPGLPRINDGSLLFLMHMMSKMIPYSDKPEDEGSKIAIVFNGSPLFTGDAGSGESNIRRWIIENDLLDAIVALPDQLFYNTGIFTYIWFLSNRKPKQRQGKIQLLDATKHFKKMDKSLGNKRNELSIEHINEITRLYADYKNEDTSTIITNDKHDEKVCSKIFNNREFGFIKATVERPLRLSFQANEERIKKLWNETAFVALAKSKKKKDLKKIQEEILQGKQIQEDIINELHQFDPNKVYKDRKEFVKLIDKTFKDKDYKLAAPLKKAILSAHSEKDETAEICRDSKGNPEPNTELRDYENIPLPNDISLPLPIDYDKKAKPDRLIPLIKEHCEKYMKEEVLPHVPDAWIDYSKTKVGYEIPINRHFYVYEPPRDLEDIEKDIKKYELSIVEQLKEVLN